MIFPFVSGFLDRFLFVWREGTRFTILADR